MPIAFMLLLVFAAGFFTALLAACGSPFVLLTIGVGLIGVGFVVASSERLRRSLSERTITARWWAGRWATETCDLQHALRAVIVIIESRYALTSEGTVLDRAKRATEALRSH